MTDQTESDGLDHTRTGVHEGRLLHASPILPAAVESASEYADLLGRLDADLIEHYNGVSGECAAAIRALEAKAAAAEAAVRGRDSLIQGLYADRSRMDCRYAGRHWEASGSHCPCDQPCTRCERDRIAEALAVEQRLAKSWQETAEKFRGERDRLDLEAARLAGEVERLKADVLRQMAWKTEAQDELEDICNALPGVAFMDPPDGGSVSIAEQVKRMYAALQSQDAEVARLTSELEKARALLSIHSGQWLEDAARRAGEGEK